MEDTAKHHKEQLFDRESLVTCYHLVFEIHYPFPVPRRVTNQKYKPSIVLERAFSAPSFMANGYGIMIRRVSHK